ncbi:MAG: hypothetical protein AAF456_06290 [Planctomycetota bacterium]
MKFFTIRRLTGMLAIALCCSGTSTELSGQDIVICNFDSGSLSEWGSAHGPVEVSRIEVPSDVRHEGVSGRMIEVVSRGPCALISNNGLEQTPYTDGSAIRFRACVPDLEADGTFVFEFRAWHEEMPTRAHMLSKIEVAERGWKTYELPLPWFRPQSDNWMQWEEAGQYGFMFRGSGRILIDNVELVDATREFPSERSPEDLRAVAFGEGGSILRGDHFSIISDAEQLEPDVLMGQLVILFEMIKEDFPDVESPAPTICLIVFETEQGYREFWPRLGEMYKATVPVPQSSGYTLFDIPASFYLEQYESVRPVYLHEVTHALLTRTFGLAGNGNWVQEGLASHYQTRWSEQDLFELIRPLVEQDSLGSLEEICAIEQLPLNRYGEAAMLVRWLLQDEKRRPQFIELISDQSPARSLEIADVCRGYFEVSVAELESEWKAWLILELEKREK